MTAVAVWIDGAPAFSLVFEAVDLVTRRPPGTAPAAVRLSVSASTMEAVTRGTISGSAATMSGRVSIDGDRSALRGLARVATGSRFRSYLSCRAEPPGGGPDLVAVLGAPNDTGGGLSQVAMDRCTAAVDACRRAPAAGLVLSGGFGAHFNTTTLPHWWHCETWLARRPGPDRPRVVGCVESRHTYDDVLLLRELVRSLRARSLTVVTSDHHAARVRFLLDIVLPGAALQAVSHHGLAAGERERLGRHEQAALARTVAATLLFGVDPLPAGLTKVSGAGRLVLRLPAG